MQDFPKWMLVIAGLNLVGVFLAPLFLFGGVRPLGQAENIVLQFAQYLFVQSMWFIPLLLFFISLDRYRRGWRTRGVTLALSGVAIETFGVYLLFF